MQTNFIQNLYKIGNYKQWTDAEIVAQLRGMSEQWFMMLYLAVGRWAHGTEWALRRAWPSTLILQKWATLKQRLSIHTKTRHPVCCTCVTNTDYFKTVIPPQYVDMALIYYRHLGKMRKQNNVERLISGGDDVWLGFKAFSLVPGEQRRGRSGVNVASTKHDWLAVGLLQMLNKYSSWLMSRVIDHHDTPEPLLLKQLSLPTDQVSSDTMCIFLNPPHTHTHTYTLWA